MKKRLYFRLSTSPKTPGWLTAILENLRATVRGIGVKFFYEHGDAVFFVQDGSRRRYFRNKRRGLWLYRNGLQRRGQDLFKSYCLNKIDFSQDDIVIDIGANSGDLFLELAGKIRAENYVAIEPNPSDFDVLSRNVPQGARLIGKAVGSENTTLDFYVATDEADSSLIEPSKYDTVISVDVVRFDTLIDDLKISAVKLVKIEAEGFEPEILSGFGDKLEICEYIAVDGGYERGKGREQTLTAITNFLLRNGFDMVDINFHKFRALYRRQCQAATVA